MLDGYGGLQAVLKRNVELKELHRQPGAKAMFDGGST